MSTQLAALLLLHCFVVVVGLVVVVCAKRRCRLTMRLDDANRAGLVYVSVFVCATAAAAAASAEDEQSI